nr:MAG: hypothetical protein [Microviridae sp.]
MYSKPTITNSKIIGKESYIAERLELKVERMMGNNEPLEEQGVDLIYQERQEGIIAGYDIRTDRWDKALEGKDAIEKSNRAKRELRIGEKTYDTMKPEEQTKFNEKFPENKFAKAQKAINPTAGQ